MTWTNISDQTSSWVLKEQSEEVCEDTEFNDSSKWNIVGGFSSKVADGKLQMINQAGGFVLADPQIVGIIDNLYTYRIIVSEYPSSPTRAEIIFAGFSIYEEEGIGTFTGSFEALSSGGLVFAPNFLGRWVIDFISIKVQTDWDEIIDKTSSWTDTSTSSSWTPLTDKTTVWS